MTTNHAGALRALIRRLHLRHILNLARSSCAPEIAAVKRLQGAGRGKRCFIMGNGPSLKSIDPAPLRQEVTFGTNAVYMIEKWLGFLPTYHVTEDRLVIEDRGAEIGRLTGSTKIYDKRWAHLIPPDNSTIHPRIVYDYSEYPGFPKFSRNAARCLWTGGTVSYLCLQLAYYMEFSTVILIGFDHSYSKPVHVEAMGDVWRSHGPDPNHIHPDYFGAGKRWHNPRVDRMELAYKRAREEFTAAGRLVVNATAGGKLEVFPRVDYGSLFR